MVLFVREPTMVLQSRVLPITHNTTSYITHHVRCYAKKTKEKGKEKSG